MLWLAHYYSPLTYEKRLSRDGPFTCKRLLENILSNLYEYQNATHFFIVKNVIGVEWPYYHISLFCVVCGRIWSNEFLCYAILVGAADEKLMRMHSCWKCLEKLKCNRALRESKSSIMRARFSIAMNNSWLILHCYFL